MQPKHLSKKDLENLLSRNVVFVKPENRVSKLKEKLLSGQKLRIKFGIDPTGPRIHLGRAATLLKLRDFQKLGHKIVLIIGDFTAQIGDPSDKLQKRPFLSKKEVESNMKTYLSQIGNILDISQVEICYNSSWLPSMGLKQIIGLLSHFTFREMIDRENFSLRFKKNNSIGLQEFFYPFLQGYDSVKIRSDLEIGGNDQLFNMFVGRKLQEICGDHPQFILGTKLLNAIDGTKMSTSLGNCIYIDEPRKDLEKKINQISTTELPAYFESLTPMNMDEADKLIKKDENIAKKTLIKEILSNLGK